MAGFPGIGKAQSGASGKGGGHNIPEDAILRRYFAGIKNLFNLYLPICDYTFLYDNSTTSPALIMENELGGDEPIHDLEKLIKMKAYLR